MKKTNKQLLALIAISAIAAGAIWYFAYGYFSLKGTESVLENEAARTTGALIFLTKEIGNLNTDIDNLNAILSNTKDQLATTTAQRNQIGAMYNDIAEKYNLEKTRVDELSSQVGQIKGSVDTLEKLKATDEELLKKYSKVSFLNENYIPESLTPINPGYEYNPDENYQFNSKVWPFLNNLLSTAKADGIDIKIVSAYRSFDEQSSLKSSYRMVYGTGANKFSADQGYSEHQLGTTVDFTTSTVGASFTGFEDTPAYKWLLANAYAYGFILSYPPDNKYYQYEPWHWRFVGRELAKNLHADNKNFYDMDQREIDKFLISFFD